MAKLESLPAELVLQILSYLHLPALRAFRQVNRACAAIFKGENQNSILKWAVLNHGLLSQVSQTVEPRQTLEASYSLQSLEGLDEKDLIWKRFVLRRFEIMRSWAGKASSTVIRYYPRGTLDNRPEEWFLNTPQEVHRIKVDELNGFFLTTSGFGGLVVSDIKTGRTLWNLPPTHVRPFAHLEYENGYVVFDRMDGRKEVWRSESIAPQTVDDGFKPNDTLIRLGNLTLERFPLDPQPSGSSKLSPRFLPHLLIPVPTMPHPMPNHGDIPDLTRAYRFVYPCLLSASRTRAYVWDVRPGRMVQVVNNIQGDDLDNVARESYTGSKWWLKPSPSTRRPTHSDVEGDNTFLINPLAGPQLSSWPSPPAPVDPSQAEGSDDEQIDMSGLEYHIRDALRYVARPEPPMPVGSRSTSSADPPVARQIFTPPNPMASGFFDEAATFGDRSQQTWWHKFGVRSLDTPDQNEGEIDLMDPLSLSADAPSYLGSLAYVELGERWVFVIGDSELRVFRRDLGPLQPDSGASSRSSPSPPFEIKPGQVALRLLANRDRYGWWRGKLGKQSVRDHPDSELVRQEVLWDYRESEEPDDSTLLSDGVSTKYYGGVRRRKYWDKFGAVHVSPNQEHLVILTASSRIIFVPFFERVIYRQVKLYDVAIELQLGSPLNRSVYLAYGCAGNPRIGVVTTGGVFIVHPYPKITTAGKPYLANSHGPGFDVTVHRVTPFFVDPDRLSLVSCLQMSDTGLWLNWARMNGFEWMDEDSEYGPDQDMQEDRMYELELGERWEDELKAYDADQALDSFAERDVDMSSEESDEEWPLLPGARAESSAGAAGVGLANPAFQPVRWDSPSSAGKMGKYPWKPREAQNHTELARAMFERKFVNSVLQQPSLHVNPRTGEGSITTSEVVEGENSEFSEMSEVHQVKFV